MTLPQKNVIIYRSTAVNRFVTNMRFEQRNSAWIETESAQLAAEVSSLAVLYRRVRRGRGRGRGEGWGRSSNTVWQNDQRSLV